MLPVFLQFFDKGLQERNLAGEILCQPMNLGFWWFFCRAQLIIVAVVGLLSCEGHSRTLARLRGILGRGTVAGGDSLTYLAAGMFWFLLNMLGLLSCSNMSFDMWSVANGPLCLLFLRRCICSVLAERCDNTSVAANDFTSNV